MYRGGGGSGNIRVYRPIREGVACISWESSNLGKKGKASLTLDSLCFQLD